MGRYPETQAFLRQGANLHAFLSGGGLRVLRVEKGGRLLGYGEAPTLSEAFALLEEDFCEGKGKSRPYHKVYDGKRHPHYLTGQSTPDGALDAWVRSGSTFDVVCSDGGFSVTLSGYQHQPTPADVTVERVSREGVVCWKDRGFVYEATPACFASGTIGMSIRTLNKVEGRDPFFYRVRKTALATVLEEALDLALQAQAEEVRRGS